MRDSNSQDVLFDIVNRDARQRAGKRDEGGRPDEIAAKFRQQNRELYQRAMMATRVV